MPGLRNKLFTSVKVFPKGRWPLIMTITFQSFDLLSTVLFLKCRIYYDGDSDALGPPKDSGYMAFNANPHICTLSPATLRLSYLLFE